MNDIVKYYKKFEKVVSGLKFAVIIITIFALTLTIGTFVESYSGAEFVGKVIYKSWWFMLLQGLMFTSILMALIVRLPFKKRLYGFYTIHTGLIILFLGSLFTYIVGIDGVMELLPNTPAQKIILPQDVLKVTSTKDQKNYLYVLPTSGFQTNINQHFHDIKIKSYIPFGENATEWIDSPEGHSSSKYLIFNENVSQDFTLSLNSASDFKSTTKMGLLSIHYMPDHLEKCFATKSISGFIFWNLETNKCFTAENHSLPVEKTPKGNRFTIFKYKGKFLKFFPDFSPLPINDDMTKDSKSPFRVFSRNLFEKKPNLFLFGKSLAYFHKRKKVWKLKSIDKNLVELPWMSFKLRLLKHKTNQYPVLTPKYTTPIQDNGELIKGTVKAVSIELAGQTHWVSTTAPLRLSNGADQLSFELIKKKISLPYQITLQKFVMNKNPGTNQPASFESYVQLLDGRKNGTFKDHHVFMNNPLKYDDFTFYQSSYFPLGDGTFGSAFSVNYDPGRFFKYFGCLLVVLGAIWHYIINRKKKKRK